MSRQTMAHSASWSEHLNHKIINEATNQQNSYGCSVRSKRISLGCIELPRDRTRATNPSDQMYINRDPEPTAKSTTRVSGAHALIRRLRHRAKGKQDRPKTLEVITTTSQTLQNSATVRSSSIPRHYTLNGTDAANWSANALNLCFPSRSCGSRLNNALEEIPGNLFLEMNQSQWAPQQVNVESIPTGRRSAGCVELMSQSAIQSWAFAYDQQTTTSDLCSALSERNLTQLIPVTPHTEGPNYACNYNHLPGHDVYSSHQQCVPFENVIPISQHSSHKLYGNIYQTTMGLDMPFSQSCNPPQFTSCRTNQPDIQPLNQLPSDRESTVMPDNIHFDPKFKITTNNIFPDNYSHTATTQAHSNVYNHLAPQNPFPRPLHEENYQRSGIIPSDTRPDSLLSGSSVTAESSFSDSVQNSSTSSRDSAIGGMLNHSSNTFKKKQDEPSTKSADNRGIDIMTYGRTEQRMDNFSPQKQHTHLKPRTNCMGNTNPAYRPPPIPHSPYDWLVPPKPQKHIGSPPTDGMTAAVRPSQRIRAERKHSIYVNAALQGDKTVKDSNNSSSQDPPNWVPILPYRASTIPPNLSERLKKSDTLPNDVYVYTQCSEDTYKPSNLDGDVGRKITPKSPPPRPPLRTTSHKQSHSTERPSNTRPISHTPNLKFNEEQMKTVATNQHVQKDYFNDNPIFYRYSRLYSLPLNNLQSKPNREPEPLRPIDESTVISNNSNELINMYLEKLNIVS